MSSKPVNKESVSIIGGGPSAMLLACHIDTHKYDVTIYEKNKTIGRKFLVAGKGGFNLTHSEEISKFKDRYSPVGFLESALDTFSNENLRTWLEKIGIKTYIGSSRRVFPEKPIKPIEVLQAILDELNSNNIKIEYGRTWNGWNDSGNLIFGDGTNLKSDITVFCMGGGSWKVTGSDGAWIDKFEYKGIKTVPFKAANCAYKVDWNADFIEKYNGSPLKNIVVYCRDKKTIGEAVITSLGIEGNAIYGLTDNVQEDFESNSMSTILIDLKPMLSEDEIIKRMQSSNKNSTETLRNQIKLDKVKIQLLKSILSKDEYLNSEVLASKIKRLPIRLLSATEIDEAISTTGGVSLDQIDANYMLKSLPNTYAIGEMLDWNAPTGGFLLQACLSMGYSLAGHLNSLD